MHKILIAFLGLSILSSCGAAPAEITVNSIETPAYTFEIFPAWVEVPTRDIETPIPEENFRIYRSPEPIGGVYSKYTIIQEELLSPTDSLSFAKRNISNTPVATRNYVKLREAEITIDGENTLLHIFEAQNTGISSTITFIQAYVVKDGTKGFTLSFSVSPTVQNYDPYTTMLQKFNLK